MISLAAKTVKDGNADPYDKRSLFEAIKRLNVLEAERSKF